MRIQLLHKLGLEVFNNEKDKYERWLIKPNRTLGNVSPESLLSSSEGIDQVVQVLYSIEYGNLA